MKQLWTHFLSPPEKDGRAGDQLIHTWLLSPPGACVCISPALSSTQPRGARSPLALLLPPGVPDTLLALPEHLRLFIPKMQPSISLLPDSLLPPHPPVNIFTALVSRFNKSFHKLPTHSGQESRTNPLTLSATFSCMESITQSRPFFFPKPAGMEEICLQWPHADHCPSARLTAHPSSSSSQVPFVSLQRFTVRG